MDFQASISAARRPLFRASTARGVCLAAALAAGMGAAHASSPGPAPQGPGVRTEQVVFAFGRGLVRLPRAEPAVFVPVVQNVSTVAPSTTAGEAPRHVNAYRSACNFTTGCH